MNSNSPLCESDNSLTISIKNGKFLIIDSCCFYTKLDNIKTFDLEEFKKLDIQQFFFNSDLKGENFNPYFKQGYHEACFCAAKCSPRKETLRNIFINVQGCNLKCKMCNEVGKQGGPEDIDLYFYALEKIKGLHLESITLNCTGEPFLRKKQTIDYLKSLRQGIDCQFVLIVTNGILLEEKDIEELSKLKIKIQMAVSVDGITKTTYENIRVNSNFEKVMNVIELLKKYNINYSINMVVQDDNINDIYKSIDFFAPAHVTFLLKRKYMKTANGNFIAYRDINISSELKKFINDHPSNFNYIKV